MRLSVRARHTPHFLITALLVGSLIPTVAFADGGSPTSLLQQGEIAAVAGRCEEALSILKEARAADPSNARAALISGQCQLRLKRYKDAEKSLEQAKKLKSTLPEVDLYLGIARYHQDDLGGAERALQSALAALPERAEVHLYIGLISLQRGETAWAAQSLARAGSADPSAVEPIASFYQGLALEANGERLAAAKALKRAQQYGKGTVWADQAAAAIERLGTERPPPWKLASGRELEIFGERALPIWMTVMAGVEFDSNVALRGDDVRIGKNEHEDDDFRFVYSLEAGYQVFATKDWTLGVLATYYGTAHESFESFDTHYPGASTWLDRRLSDATTARVQYDISYNFVGDAWVGDADRFLFSHTWTPAIYHDWGSIGNSRLFTQFSMNNFFFKNKNVQDGTGATGSFCPDPEKLCGPKGLNEKKARNRDGWGLSAGFDHAWGVLNDAVTLRGGYRFHYYDADGTDFSYKGQELQAGGEIALGRQFRFEGFASYTWFNYDNPSSYPDPDDIANTVPTTQYRLSSKDRDDRTFRLDAVIDRPIGDNATVSARYTYFDSHSNVDVFEYQRHVVGLYATIRFAP